MNATRYLPPHWSSVDRPAFRDERPRQPRRLRSDDGDDAAVGLALPPLAFVLAVALELGGGLLLIAGYQARPVALALAMFSVVAGMAFHSNFADQNQMIHFLKNLMMAGGLLQITAFGAGAISLDERLSKSCVAVANVTLAR